MDDGEFRVGPLQPLRDAPQLVDELSLDVEGIIEPGRETTVGESESSVIEPQRMTRPCAVEKRQFHRLGTPKRGDLALAVECTRQRSGTVA